MIKGTGVTQIPVFRRRRMGPELYTSISDDTASQQSDFMVGNSQTRRVCHLGKIFYTQTRDSRL